MNLKLLIVLIVPFLTACGVHTVRDDSPASDLDALVLGVKQELPKRTLPNGKLYCAELARTEDAQDECLGELEDHVYVREQDVNRAITFIQQAVERIRLSRNPCRWYQFTCRARQKALYHDATQ